MSIIPLVSICCITYNHEKYIREAIEGFLIQKTNFQTEILIFDDASTDKTQEIIKEYALINKNIITFLQSENQWAQGKYGLLDWLFPAARGKYIALCEGDDYWTDPYKLQKQVDFMEANPKYVMCFHNAIITYDDNSVNRIFNNIKNGEYTGEEILREWIIPTASVVFQKSMYKSVYHPDFIYGDIILFLSLAEKGNFWGINEVMSVYRKQKGGVTSINKFRIEKTKKFIKHHKAIQKSFDGKYHLIEKEIISRSYIGLSKRQLKRLNPLFVLSIIKAFILKPTKFYKYFVKSYFKN